MSRRCKPSETQPRHARSDERHHGERREREIDRRHRGCAFERRQVLEPLRKAEQVAEQPDDEAQAQRRPRQHRPPGRETEERDSDRGDQPGGRCVRKCGGEQASDLVEIADDQAIDQARAEPSGREHEQRSSVRHREVAPGPTPPRGAGRQHGFSATLALLCSQALHGLHPTSGSEQREDQERRREVGVDDCGCADASDDVLERLAVGDEVLDAVGNRSVRDAREKDADRPPPHDATLQSHGEPDGASQRGRRRRGPRSRRDHPRAEVAPRGERRPYRGKARRPVRRTRSTATTGPRRRDATSGRGRSETTTRACRRPRLRSPAGRTRGRAPRRLSRRRREGSRSPERRPA